MVNDGSPYPATTMCMIDDGVGRYRRVLTTKDFDKPRLFDHHMEPKAGFLS